LILFCWKPDSAVSVPVVGSILGEGAVVPTPDVFSPYNYFNRNQYMILYDKTLCVTTGASAFGIRQAKATISSDKVRKEMTFNLAVNTGEYHIFAYMISSAAATLYSAQRIYYTDS